MVTVRPVTMDDLDACRAVFADHLLQDRAETRVQELKSVCSGERTGDAWVGVVDGRVVGAGMLEPVNGTDNRAFTGEPPLSFPGSTGIVKNLYVGDGFRSCGVGSALMEAVLARARDRRMDTAVAEAWIRQDTLDAVPLLEKYGFVEVYRSGTYWNSDTCSDCGPGNCVCQGALYAKQLT